MSMRWRGAVLAGLTLAGLVGAEGDAPAKAGFLGIQIAESDEAGKEGVAITVEDRSPARRAGLLKKRDRVLKIDGREIEDPMELYQRIEKVEQGQTVKVEVLRLPLEDGAEQRLEFEVTAGKFPQSRSAYQATFQFRPAFELKGVAPEAARIEEARRGGVEYLLSQQKENGSWKVQSAKDATPAEKANRDFMQGASLQSVTPEVLTALS